MANGPEMAEFVQSECAADRDWDKYCGAVARLSGFAYDLLQNDPYYSIVQDFYDAGEPAFECADTLMLEALAIEAKG